MPSDPIVIAVDVAENLRSRIFERFKMPSSISSALNPEKKLSACTLAGKLKRRPRNLHHTAQKRQRIIFSLIFNEPVAS
jgi:hypothetical protein